METTVSSDGHLIVGGCDVVELSAKYGTPLYVYDESTIRTMAELFTKELSPKELLPKELLADMTC